MIEEKFMKYNIVSVLLLLTLSTRSMQQDKAAGVQAALASIAKNIHTLQDTHEVPLSTLPNVAKSRSTTGSCHATTYEGVIEATEWSVSHWKSCNKYTGMYKAEGVWENVECHKCLMSVYQQLKLKCSCLHKKCTI